MTKIPAEGVRACIEFPAEIQAAIELVITREIVESVRERTWKPHP